MSEDVPEKEELQAAIADLEHVLSEHQDLCHVFVPGEGPGEEWLCLKCGIMANDSPLREELEFLLEGLRDRLSLCEEREILSWVFDAEQEFATKEEYRAFLDGITQYFHVTSDVGHVFENDPDRPGVCRKCRWIDPRAESNARMHKLMRDRVIELIPYLTDQNPGVVLILFRVPDSEAGMRFPFSNN